MHVVNVNSFYLLVVSFGLPGEKLRLHPPAIFGDLGGTLKAKRPPFHHH